MSEDEHDKIARLKELRDGGTITDENFRKMVLDVLGDQRDEAESANPSTADTNGSIAEQHAGKSRAFYIIGRAGRRQPVFTEMKRRTSCRVLRRKRIRFLTCLKASGVW